MAVHKTEVLVCDGCAAHSSAKVRVETVTARWGPDSQVVTDLCRSCWTAMGRDYKFRPGMRRREYNVINFEDIPRNGA
jgi:hypothetical protein